VGLFEQPLQVINIGLDSFAEALRRQGVEVAEVDWRPPAGGDPKLVALLARLTNGRVEAANRETVERMQRARPLLVDVALASEVIPGLTPRTVLHAGPAIAWGRMCGPQRRAVLGAVVFEGWTRDAREAERLIEAGEVVLSPCNDHTAVGPMTGIISPSMPVLVVRNEPFGNLAFSTFNEGRGKALWFGIWDEGTLERLRWLRDVLAPAFRAAVRRLGGLDLYAIIAQGLQMGDECHARSAACTSLLVKAIVPPMLDAGVSSETVAAIVRALADNNHFFLNFTMAACKATADAAHGVPGSTVVTGMTRNGVDFGLRVSGLGDRWIIAPAARMDEAIYYTGYSAADAAGDIGDSAILEVVGLGGMAIAAAPTVAAFVGGSLADEVAAVRGLRAVTAATHGKFTLPTMGFEGTPLGIDVRKVVETGIVPFIDTGAVHETSETVGQIGAGVARVPLAAFQEALLALGRRTPPQEREQH